MRRYNPICIVLFLSISFHPLAAQKPEAQDGILDLRNHPFSTEGPVELRGEFEFYWNKMLNPSVENDSGDMDILEVPGTWLQLKQENPEVRRYGFGTYRLRILLPPETDRLSFLVDGVYSASG
ncbi:MAG: hypothetical protein R2751_15180 [Bacteroidales bacterium]